MVLFVGLLIRQIWHHVPEGTCLHTHFLGDVQSHTRRHICCISYRKCSQLIMLILLWRTRRAFRDEADFVWGRKGGGHFFAHPTFLNRAMTFSCLISCSNLMHSLFIIFFHIRLHVSNIIVFIIRRNYCIHTASGSL